MKRCRIHNSPVHPLGVSGEIGGKMLAGKCVFKHVRFVQSALMNRKERRATAKLGPSSTNPPGTTASAVITTDTAALLNAGLKHQQAGHFAEAEACYRRVLAAQPDHADALHLLGGIAHQAGRHELAAEFIGEAIKRDRRNPLFF